MSRYELSKAADADIDDILAGSARRWGEARATRYVLELQVACKSGAISRAWAAM